MKRDDEELNEKSEKNAAGSDDDDSSRNQSDDDNDLPPADKLGERPDNLRRRSDWFQKRTGGR